MDYFNTASESRFKDAAGGTVDVDSLVKTERQPSNQPNPSADTRHMFLWDFFFIIVSPLSNNGKCREALLMSFPATGGVVVWDRPRRDRLMCLLTVGKFQIKTCLIGKKGSVTFARLSYRQSRQNIF